MRRTKEGGRVNKSERDRADSYEMERRGKRYSSKRDKMNLREREMENTEAEITECRGNRNERAKHRSREREIEIKRTQNKDGNREGAHWKPPLQRRAIE